MDIHCRRLTSWPSCRELLGSEYLGKPGLHVSSLPFGRLTVRDVEKSSAEGFRQSRSRSRWKDIGKSSCRSREKRSVEAMSGNSIVFFSGSVGILLCIALVCLSRSLWCLAIRDARPPTLVLLRLLLGSARNPIKLLGEQSARLKPNSLHEAKEGKNK